MRLIKYKKHCHGSQSHLIKTALLLHCNTIEHSIKNVTLFVNILFDIC